MTAFRVVVSLCLLAIVGMLLLDSPTVYRLRVQYALWKTERLLTEHAKDQARDHYLFCLAVQHSGGVNNHTRVLFGSNLDQCVPMPQRP